MTWWWICALFRFIADPEASGPFHSTAALTQPTAPAPITVVVFHNQVCVLLR